MFMFIKNYSFLSTHLLNKFTKCLSIYNIKWKILIIHNLDILCYKVMSKYFIHCQNEVIGKVIYEFIGKDNVIFIIKVSS